MSKYIGEVHHGWKVLSRADSSGPHLMVWVQNIETEETSDKPLRYSRLKKGESLPKTDDEVKVSTLEVNLRPAIEGVLKVLDDNSLIVDHTTIFNRAMDFIMQENLLRKSNNATKQTVNSSEEQTDIPALPEVAYTRGICIKGKRSCSVANTLHGFRKTISSELKSGSAGASMLAWSIANIIPEELSQTKLKAINESLSWRSKSKAAQREIYQELCSLEEFSEVLQPLHDYFESLPEELSLERSPLVLKLCEGLELKAKDLLDVVNSTGKSLTEAAIVALTGKFRNSGVEPALVPSELVRLRPEWKTKVNSLESEVKLAHQQYLQKMKEQ